MEHKFIRMHCISLMTLVIIVVFLSCLDIKAQTTSFTQCLKPIPFSQTEKVEYIENIRQIIRGEDTALLIFKDKQSNWVRYFQCLEENKLGFSIEHSDLSFKEKAKLYGEFVQKALSATLESLNLDINNATAKTIAAQILFLFGKGLAANKLVNEAIVLDAKNFEAHFVLGFLNRDLAAIERAITLNPAFAPTYQTKSEILINQASALKDEERQNKYSAELEALKTMLSLPSPPSAEFWREHQESLLILVKSRSPVTANTNSPNSPVVSQDQIIWKKLSLSSKPRANYTELARMTQTSGTVRVKVTFSADGQIKNVLVMNFLPFGLTQEAVKAAKQIKFEPETRNGAPVSVVKTIEYNFNLY